NNNEAGQRGGAIDNMSSNFDLTFNDCIFNDNRTTAGADANRYGGAIHSDGSNQVYTFNNTQFNRNRASQVGGALCIFGTVTTNDCVFSENYGDRYGGAIYAATEWKPTKLIINNTTFENNTTNAWGGAIYTTDTLKITGGTFSGNKAWQSGGAIHVTGYHAKLDIFKGSDGAYPLFVDNWAGYAAPWMTTDPTTTWTRFQTIYATEVPSDFPLSHISLNVGGKVRGTDYDNLYNDYDINLPVAKLRYNANNEAIDANNETYTEYYYWLAPYNEATILNNMFTPKPGATFLNWATTKTGTGTIYEPGDTRTFTEFEVGYSVGMPVGYIDLYAQWEIAPCVAVDDYAQALSGSITAVPVIVDVLANDDLASCNASSIPLTIPIAPKNGTATVTLDNKIEFTAIADYEGADSLQYSINCNGSIDAAWLYITIVRALVPTITIAADPVSPICAGTSVVFTAAITNGGTTPEYRWTVNGSDAGTNADTYSYVPANGDEIVCELTSSSSIAYPVIVSSNVITMIVYPLSTPSMITVTGAATCSGKTATMMASTTDITNPTFRWYATATSDDLLSMENPFTTPALTGNTKYYLTVSGDNYCESVERKEVEVAIDCYTVSGTVFPFVHKLLEGGNADDEFNALFPVTAALYAAPPAMSDNPIGDLLRNEALFTMEAIYYDGSYYVPGAPKNPGYQGSANNPGSTILWSKIGKTQGEIDTTPLSGVGDIPNSDIGLYVFEDVPTGEYLLLLRRQGFSIRIAEVSVYSDTIVEHKELVAGDINTDRVVNVFDMSLINSKSPAMIGQSKYDPKFDLNGDGLVDTNDVELLGGNMGFSLYLYFDTMKWVLGL
ncbi:Ig-like domain-containing protein, partial [Bacteroidales bacterium OttesenSCG-928-J16]|nr:Ig-like domain-containing protein [Bacteroidales bacterium OttesenSCG-928-J16]